MRFLSILGLTLIIPFILLSYEVDAQVSGCTDPQAQNFDPDADVNDGSCLYAPTSFTPEEVVEALPDQILETSGLIYWNGGLWTFNDSQNLPEIYKIDTLTGSILQTIAFQGVENVDWEDITQDADHIFVGDFGNNLGNRTDLKIFILQKSAIPDTGNASPEVQVINFSYGDQTSFKRLNRNNDYDCESILSFGDSLFIFTKNWANLQTRLYALPKVAGSYVVFPKDSMDVDGLLTGADVNERGEIVLIGYKNYNPFMWLLYDFVEDDFFGGNKRRIDFSAMLGIQTEGICYSFSRNVFVSSEKTAVNPAKLFKLNTSQWTGSYSTGIEDMMEPPDGHGLLIYPNPNNGHFSIEILPNDTDGALVTELYSASGKLMSRKNHPSFSGEANLRYNHMNDGLYMLRCFSRDKVYSSPFLVMNAD